MADPSDLQKDYYFNKLVNISIGLQIQPKRRRIDDSYELEMDLDFGDDGED